MRSNIEILEFLQENSLDVVGTIFVEPGTDTKHVFIKMVELGPGERKPSSYDLKLASDKAEELGVRLNFILVGEEKEPVHEPSLKAAFTNQLHDRIRNVFVTEDGNSNVVWVEPKTNLTDEESELAMDITKKYFEVIAEKLDNIHFTNNSRFPSDYACLSLLRTKAPITNEELMAQLKLKNFDVPNLKWVSAKLDKLRKNNLVIRKKDSGQYVLTIHALTTLGSAKNRRSPDIIRALDLARRGI